MDQCPPALVATPLVFGDNRGMNDAEFLRQFESLELPFTEWTHRAHVRLAFLYLREHGLEGGVERLRRGIQAYNKANDVPEGPLQGYNETTTVAFAHIVHAVLNSYAESHPTPDGESFCDMHPQLLSKHVLRCFYSPERRILPEAKHTFVEPDLAPLPVPLSDQ